MSATPNLGLPYIDAGQAQKHVTHNEALRYLDTLVQLAILDRDLTAPPSSPAEGQRWIVKTGATDAWSGHADHVAAWQDGAWQFSAPIAGWVAYVIDEEILVAWDGDSWNAVSAGEGGGGSDPTELQDMTLLGIGTTADTTNPVSAKLNNVLWAAQTVAEGGDGNLRYKLSKESAAKTLSFLLQDNFVGCAEIGLTGDDDFHFKVSPDGTTWFEGIKIDRATGKVLFPVSGGPRELLTANRTYYVDPVNGSDSNDGLSSGTGHAFQTIAKAIDAACVLDLSIYNVTIQLSAGTYTTQIVAKSFIGSGKITIKGDSTTPGNVLISTSGGEIAAILVDGVQGTWVFDGLKITATGTSLPHGIYALRASSVEFKNLDFGTTTNAQIRTSYGGKITATGPYKISGSASYHAASVFGGGIILQSQTITLTGTPAFSVAFAIAQLTGFITAYSATFSGSATGPRYFFALGGLVHVGGAGTTFLPGNAAGIGANGTDGWYG